MACMQRQPMQHNKITRLKKEWPIAGISDKVGPHLSTPSKVRTGDGEGHEMRPELSW